MGENVINYLRFTVGPTLITSGDNPNIPRGPRGRGRVVLEDYEHYNEKWIGSLLKFEFHDTMTYCLGNIYARQVFGFNRLAKQISNKFIKKMWTFNFKCMQLSVANG